MRYFINFRLKPPTSWETQNKIVEIAQFSVKTQIPKKHLNEIVNKVEYYINFTKDFKKIVKTKKNSSKGDLIWQKKCRGMADTAPMIWKFAPTSRYLREISLI